MEGKCEECWINNDGGMWCWKHPTEICAGDCEKCKEGQNGEKHI